MPQRKSNYPIYEDDNRFREDTPLRFTWEEPEEETTTTRVNRPSSIWGDAEVIEEPSKPFKSSKSWLDEPYEEPPSTWSKIRDFATGEFGWSKRLGEEAEETRKGAESAIGGWFPGGIPTPFGGYSISPKVASYIDPRYVGAQIPRQLAGDPLSAADTALAIGTLGASKIPTAAGRAVSPALKWGNRLIGGATAGLGGAQAVEGASDIYESGGKEGWGSLAAGLGVGTIGAYGLKTPKPIPNFAGEVVPDVVPPSRRLASGEGPIITPEPGSTDFYTGPKSTTIPESRRLSEVSEVPPPIIPAPRPIEPIGPSRQLEARNPIPDQTQPILLPRKGWGTPAALPDTPVMFNRETGSVMTVKQLEDEAADRIPKLVKKEELFQNSETGDFMTGSQAKAAIDDEIKQQSRRVLNKKTQKIEVQAPTEGMQAKIKETFHTMWKKVDPIAARATMREQIMEGWEPISRELATNLTKKGKLQVAPNTYMTPGEMEAAQSMVEPVRPTEVQSRGNPSVIPAPIREEILQPTPEVRMRANPYAVDPQFAKTEIGRPASIEPQVTVHPPTYPKTPGKVPPVGKGPVPPPGPIEGEAIPMGAEWSGGKPPVAEAHDTPTGRYANDVDKKLEEAAFDDPEAATIADQFRRSGMLDAIRQGDFGKLWEHYNVSPKTRLERLHPEIGKKIYNLLGMTRADVDAASAQMGQRMDQILKGLTKEEEANLAHVLARESPPANEKIANLAGQIQEVHTELAARKLGAEKSGFVPPPVFEKIYPKGFFQRPEILAKLKQAGMSDGAINQLRKRTKGEHAQIINEKYADVLQGIGGYKADAAAIKDYYKKLSGNVSKMETIGPTPMDKNSPVMQLINSLPDVEARDDATKVVRHILAPQRYDPWKHRVYEMASQSQVATKLSNMMFSNLAQLNMVPVQTDFKSTIQSLLNRDPDVAKQIVSSGALEKLGAEFASYVKPQGPIMNMITKGFGIESSEKMQRFVGAKAGRFAAENWFSKLKNVDPTDREARERLSTYLFGEDVDKVLKQGELTPKQLDRAAHRGAELSQGMAESLDLPLGRTEDPLFRIPFIFTKFAHTGTRLVKDSIFGSGLTGGQRAKNLATWVALSQPMGYAVGNLKTGARGAWKGAFAGENPITGAKEEIKKEHEDKSIQDHLISNMLQSWMFGLPADTAKAMGSSLGVAELMTGPALTDVFKIAPDVNRAVFGPPPGARPPKKGMFGSTPGSQRERFKPLGREIVKRIPLPFGGARAAQEYFLPSPGQIEKEKKPAFKF